MYFIPCEISCIVKGKSLWYTSFYSSSNLEVDIVDFYSFIIIHVAKRNNTRMFAKVSTSPTLPLQKMRISSTNKRCVSFSPDDNEMTWKVPVLDVASRALLRPSATRRKRRGDKGHPCLSPTPITSLRCGGLLVQPLLPHEFVFV